LDQKLKFSPKRLLLSETKINSKLWSKLEIFAKTHQIFDNLGQSWRKYIFNKKLR